MSSTGKVSNYVNGYAVQSLAYSLPFDARGAADVINVPVIIVHSESAMVPDLAHAFYSAVESPKQQLWLESQGQIDFYDDPRLITPAADAVVAFWAENSRAEKEPEMMLRDRGMTGTTVNSSMGSLDD